MQYSTRGEESIGLKSSHDNKLVKEIDNVNLKALFIAESDSRFLANNALWSSPLKSSELLDHLVSIVNDFGVILVRSIFLVLPLNCHKQIVHK